MNKKIKNLVETLNVILKENIGKSFLISKAGTTIKFHNFGYYVIFYKGEVVLCDNMGELIMMIISEKNKEELLMIKAGDTNYIVTITDTENESISITL